MFSSLRGEVRLTPEAVERALRQIRMALLEADVNFKVVKAFVDRVRDRAIDWAVLESLTPAQQVVGIVRDELLTLFGEGNGELTVTNRRPQVGDGNGTARVGQDHDLRETREMADSSRTSPAAGVN